MGPVSTLLGGLGPWIPQNWGWEAGLWTPSLGLPENKGKKSSSYSASACPRPSGAWAAEVAVSPGRVLGVAEAAGPGPSP